ncbi:MAG: hypothetical protein ACOWWH_13285 [Eubacteriaceae bacterium]
MREHVKFLFMLLINSFVLYVSYLLSNVLNNYYTLDYDFFNVTNSNMYYLIGIKIFVYVLFMLYQVNRYDCIRASLGIIAGNILSLIYIINSGYSINFYGMYGINTLFDLVFIVLVLTLFNMITIKYSLATEGNNINEQTNLKKQLNDLNKKIKEKQEVLDNLNERIQDEEKDINIENEDKSKPVNTIELQTLNCPIKIEIGDKSKCVAMSHIEDNNINSSNIHNQESKTANEMIKERELKLKLKEEKIEKKEIIIEKTISNLEQISKTIKDRMNLLEEKEEYIKNQLTILEEKEDDSYIHNQVYETLFNAADISDDEVKLKDKSKEIIIDKKDLMEIRKLIEEATNN